MGAGRHTPHKTRFSRKQANANSQPAVSSAAGPGAASASAWHDPLALFHPITAQWFRAVFEDVTAPQREGWPPISRGDSTLILAPTGTGKTLTAFLWCLDRLMLQRPAHYGENPGCRVLYISPLKALAVDVERNLRSPLQGIANLAQREGVPVHIPEISIRTGDTSPRERARFKRHPGEILITTPESLYLLLTSDAAETLRTVETLIVDEIHALVPTKRGAHMALSLERLEALTTHPLQRIGLSATQRPLEEVARFLGGAQATEPGTPPSPAVSSSPNVGSTESRPDDVNRTAKDLSSRPEVQSDWRDPRLSRDASIDPSSRPEREARSGENRSSSRTTNTAGAPSVTASSSRVGSTESDTTDYTSAETAEHNTPETGPQYRPVTIVNAGARKRLDLCVEVPVEDMAKLGEIEDLPSGPASQGPKRTSIWQSIHPRLLEIINNRTSTLIFVNARRIAERLAGALNELANEPVARAHHGSLAAAQRSEIEEQLKAGRLKCLVCTSSLELGIDMGAIDLVIQIEAPPSVASGLQRIGRAGHQVGAPSHGIIFPKYRADLIACAAVTQAMHEGHVEHTRFLRNPLDILAQQIVAIVAQPPLSPSELEVRRNRRPRGTVSARNRANTPTGYEAELDEESPGISYQALFNLVRSAAPFAALSPSVFNGVLDMLAGRYPSDEFADLRPRLTWDRQRNWITPRTGAKRLAILNGGTIPDRGLYGVFLSGTHKKPLRVGELDEEMVFEARTGDTFILGASTWRIDEITQDRVLVSPAPGEPGKMPFWHGDQAGRPIEFGRRIGALVRNLRDLPRSAAITELTQQHDLDQQAAENVLRYLTDQELATQQIPDDRTIVIERVRDELGDWRVCCLTPFGSRVHTPWAMAVTARIKASGLDVETMWSEDGFVLRFPDTDQPPDADLLLLEPAEAADLVQQQLGSTALFAAKFREAATRALLLPRRRADGRTPLWQQRKRAYDLLSVASRFPSFPILLEAYRECLRDVFDMPALAEVLRSISNRQIRVHVTDSRTPSPFARALLFSYVANYIYEGDAPLAERRAQALSIDQDQLRELLGDADLRELLDINAIEETVEQLQSLTDPYRARTLDAVHDLLLRLGDLTRQELARRTNFASVETPLSSEETPSTQRHPSSEPASSARHPEHSQGPRYLANPGTPPSRAEVRGALGLDPDTRVSSEPQTARAATLPADSAVAKSGASGPDPETWVSAEAQSVPSAATLRGPSFAEQRVDQPITSDPGNPTLDKVLDRLLRSRRVLELRIASEKRLIAVEDAARFRDALGIPLPPGLPSAFLEPSPDALTDIVRRYARTHGPFTTPDLARRYTLPNATVEAALQRLVGTGRVIEGAFLPGGTEREWLDAEVLRTIRRKSLARLRKEVEPVTQATLARLFTRWQGALQPRRGLDALLDTIENLQGAPLPASILETEILPARIAGYKPADLDTLIAAGEVTWVGLDPLGERDGRIALFLSEKLPLLWPPNRVFKSHPQHAKRSTEEATQKSEYAAKISALIPEMGKATSPLLHPPEADEISLSGRELAILAYLQRNGASFFQPLHDTLGGGYPGETIDALWFLVWRGLITNDSLAPLRAYTERLSTGRAKPARRLHNQQAFRSRRTTPPTAQGRWTLNSPAFAGTPSSPTLPASSERTAATTAPGESQSSRQTTWSHAIAQQLLTRYGVVFRETAHAEALPGGFSAIYDVLKALEESGRVRRGYFAADLGATQFAQPAAVDLLRSLRPTINTDDPEHETVLLAATDPANPYGALLRWPNAPANADPASTENPPSRPERDEGARSGEARSSAATTLTGSTLTRSVGARVILIDGALTAFLRRGNPNLQVLLPDDEPARAHTMRTLAEFLVTTVQRAQSEDREHARTGLLIATINNIPVAEHPMARALLDAGFHASPMGFNIRRNLPPLPAHRDESHTTI